MKPHSSLIYPLYPSAKSADSAGSMAPQATNAPIQCRHCQGEHDWGYRSLGAGPSPASVEAWSTESALTMGKLHGVQKSRAWRLREMWSLLWLLRLGDQRVSHQSLLMEWITYGYSLSAFPQPACMACIANIKRHRRAGGLTGPCGRKPTSKRLWRAPVFMSAFSLHGCTGCTADGQARRTQQKTNETPFTKEGPVSALSTVDRQDFLLARHHAKHMRVPANCFEYRSESFEKDRKENPGLCCKLICSLCKTSLPFVHDLPNWKWWLSIAMFMYERGGWFYYF